ncbi:MAG: hypothetical protein LBV80_00275 [Deltaproteobacteria bacterium]|jgi:hypothetical protein|nr:hypothetical protein [Deltaproteobacteria bacterium]
MERALQKMASQLNQYDAASLSSMWERYAHLVSRFEPTKRWEEAALVFCLIQAMHWKNQLFNSRLIAEQQRAEQDKNAAREFKEKLHSYIPDSLAKNKRPPAEGAQSKTDGAESKTEKNSGSSRESKQRRKVLVFKLRDHGKS